MVCSKCGTEMDNNALVCPFCGQAVSDEARILAQAGGEPLTKKDFLNLLAMKSCKSNINACGIMLYIIGGFNVIWALVQGGFPIDGIILVLLGLGIHLLKSRVCAIINVVYGVFNMVILVMATRTVSGWWILAIGIYAVIYTFKFQSAWSKYQQDGTLPVEKSK